MPSIKCAYCGVAASLKCSGCGNVFYCSKDHQKADWKKVHKTKCKSYEIAECNAIGRYFRAIRNIDAGEVIFREKPLVYGPKIISAPICLGCNKFLKPQDIPVPIETTTSTKMARNRNQKPKVKTIRNYYKCSTCQWPVCNSECEKATAHLAECHLMAEKKFRCSIDYNADEENRKESAYCAILPLRCLLMKRTNSNGFQKFFQLEDHLSERLKTSVYNVLRSNLVTFFKTILSLDEFDEMTILKTAAILDTNAFEIRFMDGCSKIRAIYAETAMMAHDCVPNSYHIFDKNMEIVIRAAIDMKKGDIISLSYGQPLQSTIQRRTYLRQSKCFDCMCQRCQDPIECTTYIGSLVCSRCKSGKLVSSDPLDITADWYCEQCTMQMDAGHFQLIQNRLQFAIENLCKQSPYDLELFLEKYCVRPIQKNGGGGSKENGFLDTNNNDLLLHEKNTFVLQIKYALTQLYGKVDGFRWHEIGDTDLNRKIDLCNELLGIAEILEPGQSLFRGKLLIDLQEALSHRTERQLNEQTISVVTAQEHYREQLDFLNEANSIFDVDAIMNPIIAERLKQLAFKVKDTKLL